MRGRLVLEIAGMGSGLVGDEGRGFGGFFSVEALKHPYSTPFFCIVLIFLMSS